MNTQRLLVKCSCLKIERVTEGLAQISPTRFGFDWSLRESVCLSSISFGPKDFQVNGVTNWVEGVDTPFYNPHRESARWGVKDPDMSIKEPKHIRKRLLESSLGIGKSGAPWLSTGKTAWPEMSGPWAGYAQKMSLEFGEPDKQIRLRDLVAKKSWLTRHVQSKGQTYLAKLSGIWQRGQTSPETWKFCEARTCPTPWPDMSSKSLWNLVN
jgi:hypothetical protein